MGPIGAKFAGNSGTVTPQQMANFILGLPQGTPKDTDPLLFVDSDAAVVAEATGEATDVGTIGAEIIVGNKTYEVVASGATGDQINVGATPTEFADNIATKVTADTADTLCTAANDGADLVFTANDAGAAGNDIPLSTDDPDLTLGDFENGADATDVLKQSTAGQARGLSAYLSETITYNNDGVLGDTLLSVDVEVGSYEIELIVPSLSAVKGLNLDFAGTATRANFVGDWVLWPDFAVDTPTGAYVTSAATDFGPAAADGVGGRYWFTGSVEFTAPGSFLLRAAQNVADASNTTIERGSTLTLTPVTPV